MARIIVEAAAPIVRTCVQYDVFAQDITLANVSEGTYHRTKLGSLLVSTSSWCTQTRGIPFAASPHWSQLDTNRLAANPRKGWHPRNGSCHNNSRNQAAAALYCFARLLAAFFEGGVSPCYFLCKHLCNDENEYAPFFSPHAAGLTKALDILFVSDCGTRVESSCCFAELRGRR